MATCCRCKRTGIKICDGECPFSYPYPCDDCERVKK